MSKGLIICAALLATSCGSFPKKRAIDSNELRQEATEFIFSILKNYFDDSCQATYDLFSDSLINLSEVILEPKPPFSDLICKQHSKIVTDKSKTLDDYFATYNYIIKDYNQTILSIGGESTVGELLKEGDFLFSGIRRKPEFYQNEDFIWTKAFLFLVRKENGIWRLKGGRSE